MTTNITIVADKERGVVCYVLYGYHGISCVFDPTSDLIIPQEEEDNATQPL